MSYRRLKLITILWIVALICGSLSPVEVKVAVGTETNSPAAVEQEKAFTFHRVMHYIAFGVGAALLIAVARTPLRCIAFCAALIALGCLLEWVQFTALGSPILETGDMRDDALAVAVGGALAAFTGFGRNAR